MANFKNGVSKIRKSPVAMAILSPTVIAGVTWVGYKLIALIACVVNTFNEKVWMAYIHPWFLKSWWIVLIMWAVMVIMIAIFGYILKKNEMSENGYYEEDAENNDNYEEGDLS